MSLFGHRTRLATTLAAASVALPLAGCTTYHEAASNNFSEKALTDAGSAAGIQIQVDGKVAGVQGDALAKAVAAAMPATVGGKPVHYVACEQYTECPGDHLVFTFEAPAARPRAAYPPALPINYAMFGYSPGPNNVAAKLALFQGGNPVSSVSAQTDAVSPSDPNFQSMIGQMAGSVLSGPDAFDWVGFP